MAFLKVLVLVWPDLLVTYVIWIMQTYLTNVWKLGFTHAAGIMNVANGLPKVLPLVFYFFVDAGLGNKWMLILSSLSYVFGLGFLSMSTPPVLANITGTCKEYEPHCLGSTQKALFYTALALIAVGISGHIVSLVAFFVDQFKKPGGSEFLLSEPDASAEVDVLSLRFQPVEAMLAMLALVTKTKEKVLACVLILIPTILIIVLPYIEPWSLRIGIPAICTLVATLAFLLGFPKYNESESKGSPITNVFKTLPSSSELYENSESNVQKLPHTYGLRFLDKAAIEEGPRKKRWILCMFPVWITLILCGVVTSIGNTYFVAQSNHLDYKVGIFNLPHSLLLLLYEMGKTWYSRMYRKQKYPPPVGIALATLSAVLCCIVAALVENRRINVIRDHGLIEKPDASIPMTVFWLVPQYILLAGLDSFYENSVSPFLSEQGPPSMQKYLPFFNPGLSGFGIIGSVLTVYIVGRISGRDGKPSWFQYDLNASRLDRYYWTLAALSAANFIWFLVCATLFPCREQPKSNVDVETANQGGYDSM